MLPHCTCNLSMSYYFAKYDRVSQSGNVTSGTIACGEKEKVNDQFSNSSRHYFFFFVAGSLEPYEIQFAPRHSRVSFLDPRYASTFHWHASCHLLLQRATLSASRRFGAMRCSVEQRRDATRHVASCHTAARHADRWYSRCDARPLYFRPALESASNSIIRVPKRPPWAISEFARIWICMRDVVKIVPSIKSVEQ